MSENRQERQVGHKNTREAPLVLPLKGRGWLRVGEAVAKQLS